MQSKIPNEFRQRRVTLIGLGRRTNVALARFLVRQGAIVRISELRSAEQITSEIQLLQGLPVELCLGGHRAEHVSDADVVFVAPGVPRQLAILDEARRRGIPVSNEIELVFARSKAPIIGITGSAGKTTTTSLVGEMLRLEGFGVHVGGNIGVPLIEVVDSFNEDSWVVLELSSYQLETLSKSAHIGAVLNVTPNHLDRHPTFEHYRESKLNLIRYQSASDFCVLGADDPEAAAAATRFGGSVRWFSAQHAVSVGTFRRGDSLYVRDDDSESAFTSVSRVRLPGDHNVLNVLAAAAIARAAHVGVDSMERVATTFRGVEHRLEFLDEIDGVTYVNDSIATAPERSVAALRAFHQPIVLIAGGRSKHLPLDEMAVLIGQKARCLVLMGEMADEVESAVRSIDRLGAVAIERAGSIEEAVNVARRRAQTGDVVLLSPGGTSFDQFRDFEERGQRFRDAVRALKVSQK